MKVLSLFDGISCGLVALRRAGIPVEKYYASEICETSIEVSNDNHIGIIRLGDITKWREWDIDWSTIDLVIGGSPCQSFSVAGKGEGFDGKSKLYWCFSEIVKHIKISNPEVKFLLENVRMKKEWQSIINEDLGVMPININSKLLSAQLRNRFYWCNWNVEQPEDKGIFLKDIIEDGFVDREKSRCILESESRPLKNKENMVHRYFNTGFTTIIWKDKELSDYAKTRVKERLGDKKGTVYNWFNDRVADDKSNTLIAGSSGWSGKSTNLVIKDDDIRYFNQIELERLQTLPVGYTKCLTRNKAAGVIGNGWTVDVIVHLLNGLINKNE